MRSATTADIDEMRAGLASLAASVLGDERVGGAALPTIARELADLVLWPLGLPSFAAKVMDGSPEAEGAAAYLIEVLPDRLYVVPVLERIAGAERDPKRAFRLLAVLAEAQARAAARPMVLEHNPN